MELPFKPETEFEEKIVNDQEWMAGAMWGEPREGHPEGKISFHIKDVLENVTKLAPNSKTREKLRLIALVHDTFKYKVDIAKPLTGNNHHAFIARKFAEKYIDNVELLEIIELHDEAFNSWQKGNRDNKWDKAEERATTLLKRINSFIDLYLIFYKCDNQTDGKDQACVEWFENFVKTNSF